MICGTCQAEQPDGNRFCGQCGAPLGGQARPAPPPVPAPARPAGERRQMTMLFYDLVGSTALATRCDPEDFSVAMETFHRVVAAAMREMGGHVGARVGDGAVVYFGYPEAQEDAADRAVLAGLKAAETGGEVILPDGEKARVRVGVATGEGIVSRLEHEGAGNEVVGSVGNLAARLQSAAAPGTVVISDATRRLLRGDFELEDLGAVEAKGFSTPVQAWRVAGRIERDALDEPDAVGEAPFVGRTREIEALTEMLGAVAAGEARVALVTGDVGLGKSRLVSLVARRALARGFLRIALYCSAQTQEAPFRPFILHLQRARRRAEAQAADGVGLAPGSAAEDAALLAGLLDSQTPESPAVASLNAAQKRERRIEALIRQIRLFGRQGPVLVIFEDAQWADATSLAVLERAVRGGGLEGVLILITGRPEFHPPWLAGGEAGGVAEIALAPLDAEASATMVSRLAGERRLPPSVRRAIVERADGVPLFLEEITRSALELAADAGEGAEFGLPMTLQDSLLARLDRLGPLKAVAQTAAVVGRRFSRRALDSLSDLSAGSADAALQRLAAAGLIAPDRDAQFETHVFKHALFQQTAYGTLLRTDRRRLNARLLAVIEAEHPAVVAAEPERLAHYATEAGETVKAVGYWLRAGLQAIAESAMTEAASRLRKGLQLAAQLPEDEARWRLELRLELTLGKAQIATVGYANPDTGATFRRARALCQSVGETTELLAVLHGLWIHDFIGGRFASARLHSDELLRLAETEDNQSWMLIACRAVGAIAFPMAEFALALPVLRRGLALFSPDRRSEYAQVLVDDPRVVMLMYLSWVQLYLGRAEAAWEAIDECLLQARALGQPHSLAYALAGRVLTALFADVYDGVAPFVAELAELAREHEMAYWSAGAEVLLGRYLVGVGEEARGGEVLESALEHYLATGSLLYLPTFITWTAEAHGRLGRTDEALALIARAKALMAETGIENDAAEILRVEGELRLALGDEAAARRAFESAWTTLERQGAEIHRPRVAASLAKLAPAAG